MVRENKHADTAQKNSWANKANQIARPIGDIMIGISQDLQTKE
jgi:hypothetical protein